MPVFPAEDGSSGTWDTELRNFFSPYFDLATGVLTGIVPFARMKTAEQYGSGSVAITTAQVDLITLASLSVVAGDRVDVRAYVGLTAAASTTFVNAWVVQSSGTATGTWHIPGGFASTNAATVFAPSPTGAQSWGSAPSLWLHVTGTGTLVLKMQGQATGANCTSGTEYLIATVLRGA